MIDTSNWKEFRVGDYFHCTRGKSRRLQILSEGSTPIIAAAQYNQGIAGYYDVPTEYENTITISCNGVGCGSTFYHDYPFAITGDAIVLERIGKIPQTALHYIVAVFDAHFMHKYSYENKCSADKAEAEIVKLPATSDGQPDWAYMESYMKQIMEESKKRLKNLKKKDSQKRLIDVSTWKDFRIGDYFNTYLSKDDIQPKKNIFEGNTPLISSGKSNNGIVAYIRNDNAKLWNSGTITVDMFGKAFYQNEPYYCVSHGRVNILDPKFNMSEKIALFLISAIEKVSSKYEFTEMCTGIKLANDIIKLPATSDGQPDWAYMESYMKKIMNKSKKTISALNLDVQNKRIL